MRSLLPYLIGLALFASACATSRQETVTAKPERTQGPGRQPAWQEGLASYYHDSLHGRLTANGQRYDREAATCAHRTYKFGTQLHVQSVETGKTVQCRVNDRGPFVKGRIVDLSRRLARDLGMLDKGVARVRIAPVQ
jgi:rare lipoprotein A